MQAHNARNLDNAAAAGYRGRGSRMGLGAVLAAALFFLPGLTSRGATPLGGQATGERLDRRRGDRQLRDRLQSEPLHQVMRSEMLEPQARSRIRVREWDEEIVPRPQRFDDHIDKQRRVRATLD